MGRTDNYDHLPTDFLRYWLDRCEVDYREAVQQGKRNRRGEWVRTAGQLARIDITARRISGLLGALRDRGET